MLKFEIRRKALLRICNILKNDAATTIWGMLGECPMYYPSHYDIVFFFENARKIKDNGCDGNDYDELCEMTNDIIKIYNLGQ